MKESIIEEQEVLPHEPSKLKLFLDKNPLPRVDDRTIIAIAIHLVMKKGQGADKPEDNLL